MAQEDGSIGRTLLKTGATVGLTAALVLLLRWVLSILPRLDSLTGSHVGGDILHFLASDGQAQTQKTVAIVLMVLCFGVAVLLVHILERLLQRGTTRRS
ncbi:hypothetical protein ASY01nite_07590 [Acetobacter syzygii]|uniref:hypothetical protein n=1 Tax=Acetobacter syzygii TaxID=146476 RepID=UPI0005DC1D1E|nr:hypothetical protein [Acetobacter syzygii]GAN70780.1 hypothetical protein Absy_009_072 [Acetobacter syzygii]GBR62832.1 hypothetical protein AA0483_0565 [Acetobacter syzygii NRIC 0483]GEL55693.1 hypothetical protein ASY01nite_07590 [Acetobacter syzygii]